MCFTSSCPLNRRGGLLIRLRLNAQRQKAKDMEDCQNSAQGIVAQPVENIVEADDGGMFTTSLIVAQAFEKNHYDVLKAITNLECSPEFNERNFAAVEYKDAKGEMRPAYRLTRDGFAFLAMGFTGKRAALWKEKFLEAFNAMERRLTAPGRCLSLPPTEPDDVRQQRIIKILRGLIAYWAFVDKLPYAVAELALAIHVGLERLEDITEEENGKRIQAAFDYLWEVSNRPTGDMEGPGATQNEMTMLRHMLTACGQWRFTRDQDFAEYFEKLTGINPQHPGRLSAHDVGKMLSTAGYLLHQTYQHTVDWNAISKEISE